MTKLEKARQEYREAKKAKEAAEAAVQNYDNAREEANQLAWAASQRATAAKAAVWEALAEEDSEVAQ